MYYALIMAVLNCLENLLHDFSQISEQMLLYSQNLVINAFTIDGLKNHIHIIGINEIFMQFNDIGMI